MDLNYKIVKADTGVMGGLLSEEFQAITDIGEDTVVLCENCDYSSNIEVTPLITKNEEKEEVKELEVVLTKNLKSIEEVSGFLNINIESITLLKVNTQLYK